MLAVLGLTGAILVHRDAWIMLPHAANAQITDTARIAATVETLMADPDHRPQSIIFASDTLGLHRLSYGKDAGAYADQAGKLVTRWDSQWERPELWLFDLHHHLFASDTGETVIGVAALCGLFFVISGVILWWRTRRTYEFRLLPRRMSRTAIQRHHRDLGVVVAPLLLISCYTGAALVFRPVTMLVLGPAAPAVIAKSLKAPEPTGAALAGRLDWGAMIREGRARFPNAEPRILSLPRKDSGLISLRLRQPGEWTPNGRTVVYFAADSGRVVQARDALALPAETRGFNTFYPLHAGKVGGLAYRLVMTLSGIAMTLLGSLAVWTFWFRRPKAASMRLKRNSTLVIS